MLLETLGLDAAASAQVKAAFLDFAREYRDLEKSHTVLTNTLPKALHLRSEFCCSS